MSDTISNDQSPFHSGEQQVQSRLGVRDIEDWARKIVRPYMPEEHRAFHTTQPFLVAAARDQQGRPWATLLTGPDGFVTSPDPSTLRINTQPVPGDALEQSLLTGTDIGLLGIELATRRRNRVNGRLAQNSTVGYDFTVTQAFGNCPQYIRERAWHRVEDIPPGTPTRGTKLTPNQRRWIAGADTFFIATGHRDEGDSPTFGMDASHRGGDQGFVAILDDTRLIFPDYAGNNHFNTIGNLVCDPRIGLLFLDFTTGGLLQLTGKATIDWDSPSVAKIPGARRLVTIDIDEIVELPTAVPLRWSAQADAVRSLRLIEKTAESADVTSFLFESRDGGPLPLFQPGQYLPIELPVPGYEHPVRRSYSLSGPPSQSQYRISVKREPQGLASRHLHDAIDVGTILNARVPAGDFRLPKGQSPIVLVSAGVGITPMAGMLHALAREGGERPVWFVHGARDGNHHPLATEINDLALQRPGIQIHVAYSKPQPEDIPGNNHHSQGRVDGALLRSLTTDPTAHYYICGPNAFMAAVQNDLESHVPQAQIHTETFGPAG